MPSVYNSFLQSFARLREILKAEPTVANRDSAIQRFELTFELSWKVFNRILRERGIVATTPRDCFNEAFRAGLIPDDPKWIQMIQDRNITSHTYNEKLAEQIYKRIFGYVSLFELVEKICEEIQ